MLVSSNDENPHEEHQYYIPPGEHSGPFAADVDAIFFPNGGAIKIPDGTVVVILHCVEGSPNVRYPFGGDFIRKHLPKRLFPQVLPDQAAVEREFGKVKPPKACQKKCP